MNVYKGKEIRGLAMATPGFYALIKVSPQGREDYWELLHDYGRTNMSHEPLRRGWLGSTNNVSRHACGCVEVYVDAKGRTRVQTALDEALVNEVDGGQCSVCAYDLRECHCGP